MELTVTKSKHGYRIVSNSTQKHPVLSHLATCLRAANKLSPIKIGIYSITGGEFSSTKRVYSYISDRVEHMNKKKFYKFMKGECSMSPKKPWSKQLKMSKKESKEIQDLFSVES